MGIAYDGIGDFVDGHSGIDGHLNWTLICVMSRVRQKHCRSDSEPLSLRRQSLSAGKLSWIQVLRTGILLNKPLLLCRFLLLQRNWALWLRQCLMLLLGCVSFHVATGAMTLEYAINPLLVAWETEESIFECRLFHPIDDFGLVEFYHQAGEDVIFLLKPIKPMMKPGKAALHLEPPAWKPSHYAKSLGLFEVPPFKEEQLPQTNADQANNMMVGLLNGLQTTITRRAYFDDATSVRVKITPAQFDRFYPKYLTCIQQLLPVNYDQIKRNKILFKSGQKLMSEKDEKWMEKVALYVNNDPRISAIYIDGHSDSYGRRYHNRRLSETRAFGVQAFLLDQGINPDLMTVRYHGGRYPIATNKTPQGRAKNRRVTVRVLRSDKKLEPDVTDKADAEQQRSPADRPVLQSLEQQAQEQAQAQNQEGIPNIAPLDAAATDQPSAEGAAQQPPVEGNPPPAVENPPPAVENPPPAVETPPPAVETP